MEKFIKGDLLPSCTGPSQWRVRSKAVSVDPNHRALLLEFLEASDLPESSKAVSSFKRSKSVIDSLDLGTPSSLFEELRGLVESSIERFWRTRAEIFSNLFKTNSTPAEVELFRFQVCLKLILHLARCLKPDPKTSPQEILESLKRELLYAKLLPYLREVRCKICLVSIQKCALDIHSENCFKFNNLKTNLEKLNQKIFPLCEKIKRFILDENFQVDYPYFRQSTRELKTPRSEEPQKFSLGSVDDFALQKRAKNSKKISEEIKDQKEQSKMKQFEALRNHFIINPPLNQESNKISEEYESQLSLQDVQSHSETRHECSIANMSLRQSNINDLSEIDVSVAENESAAKFIASGRVIRSRGNEANQESSSQKTNAIGLQNRKEISKFRSFKMIPSFVSPSNSKKVFNSLGKSTVKDSQVPIQRDSKDLENVEMVGGCLNSNTSTPSTVYQVSNFKANRQKENAEDSESALFAFRQQNLNEESNSIEILPSSFTMKRMSMMIIEDALPVVSESIEHESIQAKDREKDEACNAKSMSNSDFPGLSVSNIQEKETQNRRDFLLEGSYSQQVELNFPVLSKSVSVNQSPAIAKNLICCSPEPELQIQTKTREPEDDENMSKDYILGDDFDSASSSSLCAQNIGETRSNKAILDNNDSSPQQESDQQLPEDVLIEPKQIQLDVYENFKKNQLIDHKKLMLETLKRSSATDYVQIQNFETAKKSLLLISLGRDVGRYKQNLMLNPFLNNYFNDQALIHKLTKGHYKNVGFDLELERMVRDLVRLVIKRSKITQRSKKYLNVLQKLSMNNFEQKIRHEFKARSLANLNELDDFLLTNRAVTNLSFASSLGTTKNLNKIHREQLTVADLDGFKYLRRNKSDSQLVYNQSQMKIYEMKTNPTSIKDFTIERLIGKGGYGSVYLVKQKLTNDYFAMKSIKFPTKLNSKFIENLQNEISVLKLIKGKFLTKAYFSFIENDCLFILMEYLVGGDFRLQLEAEGYFDFSVTQFYAAELVMALEELHSEIVHRDLKPENLLLDANGHLKLADFGLSELHCKYLMMAEENFSPSPVQPSKRGTPDYIPPEVLFPKSPRPSVAIPESSDHIAEFALIPAHSPGDVCHLPAQSKPTASPSKLADCSRALGARSRAWGVEPGHRALCAGGLVPLPAESPNVLSPQRLVTQVRQLADSRTTNKSPRKNTPRHPDSSKDPVSAAQACEAQQQLKVIDWWAVGCLIYEFSTGVSPFGGESVKEIEENIRNHRIEWIPVGNGPEQMTPETRDIIEKFLERDPRKRLGFHGAAEIKEHPFFKEIDWKSLKSRKAPFSCTDPKLYPLSGPCKISIMRAESGPHSELADLRMNRVDLLDERNQKSFLSWKSQYNKILSKLSKLDRKHLFT